MPSVVTSGRWAARKGRHQTMRNGVTRYTYTRFSARFGDHGSVGCYLVAAYELGNALLVL